MADREAVAAFGRLAEGFGFPKEFSAVLETRLPGDEQPHAAAPAALETERRAATARWGEWLRRLCADPEAQFEKGEPATAA